MSQVLIALFALFMFCTPVLAADNLESLQKQLQSLEAELPEILKEETDLDTQHDYVKRVLALREKIVALEEANADQCWFRNESAFLYPADPNLPAPPPSDCDFYGSCKQAARFAQQKGYGFEGKCKLTPEPNDGPHILQLVSVSGPPPGKTTGISDLDIRYKEDSVTAAFIRWIYHGFGKDDTTTDITSFGFGSYPKTIELGEPFSVSANMIRQQNHANRSCRSLLSRKTFKPLTLQRKPQTLDFSISLQIPVNSVVQRMKATSSAKVEYMAPCLPEVEHVNDPVTFDVGGNATLDLSCTPDPEGPKQASSQSLHYHYQCAISGSGVKSSGEKITLFWHKNRDGTPKKTKINKISVGVHGKGLGHYGRPYESIILHYEPDTSGTLKAQDFGAVQHTVEVSNTWQDDGGSEGKGEDSSEMVARDPGTGNETDVVAREEDAHSDNKKDPREGETGKPTSAGSATPQTSGTTELNPNDPDVLRWMDEWFRKAEPPQNATDEGYFEYNQWGQLVGAAADGGKAEPKSRPDTAAGRTPLEHLWAERDKLDSVDHCTLGEFVERRIAGEGLESCRGRYVPVMPNMVGLPVWQFLKQLENRGIYLKWQDGSVSNDPAKIDTVEKQNPAPGTPLKADRRVEVWVYHPSANTASVPNFVGLEAAKAKTDLEKLGIKVKWREGSIAKDTAQQSLVEKQNPAPGTSLKHVKEVELWVYRYATNIVQVPNVVGMTYATAKVKLKKMGLQAKFGKMNPSNPFTLNPKQKIVTQEAVAGTKVLKGTTVVLNFDKEGSKKRRPPLTLGGGKSGKQRLPEFLTREQYQKVRMPDVVGLTYEKAASKLKAEGLKPVRKRGPHAPRRTLANTVKEAEHPANRLVDAGAKIRITVYDTYREKKQPDTIVKRDPASAFGGKHTPDDSATINVEWAGMWRVDRKYDMELHISGNTVTGRYGKNMNKTIEGRISGNILTGWWREGKTYGRFKNTLSDDGNSWSGVWNTMTDKLGGWNGGWKAKRIGNKKPSTPNVNRDLAPAFGSPTPKNPRKTPPMPLPPVGGKGHDVPTAGSCRQLPPPPSYMRNPTCQCSEGNALFGTTTFTRCYWVDKK